jgi:hypothetical protein
MAKRGKTKKTATRWVDDFSPTAKTTWAVPVSWILAQALKHLLAEEEQMVFSCQDGRLYIRAYQPDQEAIEAGRAKRRARSAPGKKAWTDEWPPWP